MSIKFKVKNGTPNNPKSLCKTCSNSVIVKGAAESQTTTYCKELSGWGTREPLPVPFEIIECSSYCEIGHPTLYDMRKIAWIITADKDGRKIGFVPATKFAKDEDIDVNEIC